MKTVGESEWKTLERQLIPELWGYLIMFANRKNPHVFVPVLILLVVLLCLLFAALAENKSINTSKVKGAVTNLD